MAIKAAGGTAAKKPAIPPEQWKLPVSFTLDGKETLTLREFTKRKEAKLSFSSLSDDQRAQLTAKRIEMQPKFELGMIGAGMIDKERAIAEVKAKSRVGRLLMEIEARVINMMIEQAASEE